MENIGDLPGRILIDPNRAVSGKDLVEESSKLPIKEFDAGHGVKVLRQGMMIKIVGGENLSPHAIMAAIRASQMGGDAGRAMYDTYNKANPDHFDGSQTFDAIMKRAHAPHSRPPASPPPVATDEALRSGVTESGGKDVTLKGTPGNDFLTALDNSILFGGAGDDELIGGNGSRLYGGTGNDTLSGGHSSTLYGGAGNDVLSGGTGSTLHGDDGNDVLSTGDYGILNGGVGDDILSTYNGGNLSGDEGNDRLSAYGNSQLDGGLGDDFMEGYDNTEVVDMDGDNYVSAYRDSAITTGAGNDWLRAYTGATIRAGNGNNMISTYGDSTVVSGDDADMIEVGVHSQVISGGGNDLIDAGSDSFVNAGAGDDRVTLKGDSIFHFKRGDGNDILGGGNWGAAYRQTENLASSVITFGDGITTDDLQFQSQGNDLLISLGHGDSLTLRDYQRHGIPSLIFNDGTSLSSGDVTNAVGPGDAYRPVSQLMQSFYDANAAYQASLANKDV